MHFCRLGRLTNELLSPMWHKPKYSIVHNLLANWEQLLEKPHCYYCRLEKIGWTPKGGCVLYLISYNSLTSFYVGNRQKYLQDKINLLFGKPLVDKIINREEPRTMTCPMKRTTKPLPPEAEGNSLEKALADLGYWVKIKCP